MTEDLGEASTAEASILGFYGSIRSYIGHLTRDASLADDLAQETYIRAHHYVSARGPPRTPQAWLRAIALNVTRDYFSKPTLVGPSFDELDHDSLASSRPSELEQLLLREEDEQEADLIAKALDRLPKPDQQLILGFYLNELSCKELGESNGITQGAVKMRLFKVRARLRNYVRIKHHRPNDSGLPDSSL